MQFSCTDYSFQKSFLLFAPSFAPCGICDKFVLFKPFCPHEVRGTPFESVYSLRWTLSLARDNERSTTAILNLVTKAPCIVPYLPGEVDEEDVTAIKKKV